MLLDAVFFFTPEDINEKNTFEIEFLLFASINTQSRISAAVQQAVTGS